MRFIPVCPEVECGLPVPRESMRLVGNTEDPRLMTRKTATDHTEKMLYWSKKKLVELEGENLCGFIFKSKSPSSGMERVKVYGGDGKVRNNGIGLFARAFMLHFPLLPTEEDGRLHDLCLRENFIERIFVYHRWQQFLQQPSWGSLVAFHTAHKLSLMAHSPAHYRQLGKLVADARNHKPGVVYTEYARLLFEGFRLKATVKKNVNVLHHMLGYFKKDLSSDEKQEMLTIIGQYHKGFLPLIIPISLFNHYVRKYDQNYLAGQIYLSPHPVELKLRNHA